MTEEAFTFLLFVYLILMNYCGQQNVCSDTSFGSNNLQLVRGIVECSNIRSALSGFIMGFLPL